MKLSTLLRSISNQLQNFSSTAQLDSYLIVSHILNITRREDLLLNANQIISQSQIDMCNTLVNRRLNNEPIAYLTGRKEFWEYDFIVTPDVLIPRPETELIIELVLKFFPDQKQELSILDLGTGSGCIPITLLKLFPNACADAVDISKEALAIARQNADLLDVLQRLTLIQSNWFQHVTGKYDIIISNPPYISLEEWHSLDHNVKEYEPKCALTDNLDGLSHYHTICSQLGRFLKKDGLILFECGYTQSTNIKDILISYGFNKVHIWQDLAGKDRIISAL